MTANLSSEVLDEYKATFALFDADGDGTITIDELGSVMKSLGQNPSDSELRDMINEVDTDGDGVIDFNEFVEMMSRASSGGDETLQAFKMFDTCVWAP